MPFPRAGEQSVAADAIFAMLDSEERGAGSR